MSTTDRRLAVPVAAGLAAAVLLAACTGGATPSPSAPPSASPPATPAGSPEASPSAPTGEVDHPTGATDVILRFEEGGGFVMPAFAMVQVPHFTLYGDGTVIYRSANEPFPETAPGDPMRFPRLRIAKMTEEAIQALLRDALGPGGLAVARPRYDNQMVADASTAVFTLDAGGRQKQVSVYALGLGMSDPANPGPDDAILEAMATFAERLRNFDAEIAAGNAEEVGVFEPERYRASLLEGGFAEGPALPWPWPEFGPDTFAPADSAFGFPSRVLSVAEVGALGVDEFEGGISGIPLAGPDAKVYVLGLRPLLPDEER